MVSTFEFKTMSNMITREIIPTIESKDKTRTAQSMSRIIPEIHISFSRTSICFVFTNSFFHSYLRLCDKRLLFRAKELPEGVPTTICHLCPIIWIQCCTHVGHLFRISPRDDYSVNVFPNNPRGEYLPACSGLVASNTLGADSIRAPAPRPP